jgi:hypothetical protein
MLLFALLLSARLQLEAPQLVLLLAPLPHRPKELALWNACESPLASIRVQAQSLEVLYAIANQHQLLKTQFVLLSLSLAQIWQTQMALLSL